MSKTSYTVIKIDPFPLNKYYDKLSDETSLGYLNEVKVNADFLSECAQVTSHVVDDNENFAYDLYCENKPFCVTSSRQTIKFNLINGLKITYDFHDHLNGHNINHLATSILYPSAYFNNKIVEFLCGTCYLVRKDRSIYKYSSCTLDQFLSEFDHKKDFSDILTRIKKLNGAYHSVKISHFVDFLENSLNIKIN